MKRSQSFVVTPAKTSKPKRRKSQRKFQPYSIKSSSVEKKFLDTNVGTSIGTIAQTMEFANLNVVPQGDTESSRQGRKILVKKIHGKGNVNLQAATAAASTSETVKLMILCDTQTNKAQFSATDLLESDAIFSFRNLANQSRFKVLWQTTIDLSAGGAAASGAAFVFSEKVKKWSCNINCNIPINFDNSDTDGLVDTQTENSLVFVTQSQTGNITTLGGQVRIRFSDL